MLYLPPHIHPEISNQLQQLHSNSIVLDLGTSSRFAKEMASYRSLLSKTRYFALGYQPDTSYATENCDISGDVLSLPFASKSVDCAISFEVIEHVKNPMLAVAEMHRILKPKGQLILTTPFLLPYHGKGDDLNQPSHQSYPDFWRFTHQGLQLLFSDFNNIIILPFTNTLEHYLLYLIRYQILNQPWIVRMLHRLQTPKPGNATHRHLVIARK